MADLEAHPAGELAPQGFSVYSHKRSHKDVAWTAAYALLNGICFFWAIAAFAKQADYSSKFYSYSLTCSPKDFEEGWSKLSDDVKPADVDDFADFYAVTLDTFSRAFYKMVSIWLPITAALGICFSIVYLLLFRYHAEKMVWTSVVFSIVWVTLFAVLYFMAEAPWAGGISLVISFVIGVLAYKFRADLRQCAKLMGVAGKGLAENGKLIHTAVLIKTTSVSILVYYFFALLAAQNVGSPQPNPLAMPNMQQLSDPGNPYVGVCMNYYGYETDCCVFRQSTWAKAFSGFTIVSVLWTVSLVMQIKLYVVADVIAQWYFQPAGAFSNGPDRPSVRRALRNVMVEGFGTAAFAGAVLAVLRWVRSVLHRKSREGVMAWICCMWCSWCCCLNCVLQPLLAMLEKFNRFAMITAAITGEGFIPAAQRILAVLKRNFLKTHCMWWVPDWVTGTIVFMMNLAWGSVVFFATVSSLKSRASLDEWDRLYVAILTTWICFLCMGFILTFIAHMLLDITNTIYVCFSLDRDTKSVTSPDVHAIYTALPIFVQGAVIEQPDGGMDYGRPEQGQQGQGQGQAGGQAGYAGAVAMQPLYSDTQPLLGAQGQAPVGQYMASHYAANPKA